MVQPLQTLLKTVQPRTAVEAADLARLRALAASTDDPWTRSSPLHITGSALIVHPPTRRVLLRWHERQQAWLQVGGHGDPGESDPWQVAAREAREETGLEDLVAWPSRAVLQVTIVPVPAGRGEPVHEHGDIRFALATATPDAIAAESESAPLQWLSVPQALQTTAEDNLREALARLAELFEAV